jgi:D-lactate dehydrogenase
MNKFKQHLLLYIDKSRIIDDKMLCYAYGTDASMYRLTPKLVVIVENHQEVHDLLILANKYNINITFRAAGTSLSGQALTNSVLVVLSNTSWQNYTILDNGQQIVLEPGIIGATANAWLKPFGTKIGPDPASINACKIGGIAANNSSGMCCGTAKNSYNTLAGLKLILANGTTLDTRDTISRANFVHYHKNIIDGIIAIRENIITDNNLTELIKHKFKIKNTSGYSLNAFLDFSDPIDILSHLMIGSEGTLGFISEICYNCVPDNQFKAVSLIFCSNLSKLITLTEQLSSINIDAIELLDITSLNSIKHLPVAQKYLPILTDDTAAMLIEISGVNELELKNKIIDIENIVNNYPLQSQVKFTIDEKIYHDLWSLRKGILPTIGGARLPGSSVVIEDIAVDITQMSALVSDLRKLFVEHNYTNAAIFGHIKAGNIHFVFTPRFDIESEIDNYKQLMAKMCNLVAIKYQGSLKAEHGSGRNIAPFAELEWGSNLYSIMWQIKHLLDPNGILNPDVKLTQNPNLHIENLKQLYPTNSNIDSCIECGFCETVCPSKNLTLTPRQRITTYRKMEQLGKNNLSKEYKHFRRKYKYYAIDTCATTGLCQTKCPVGINTGSFILSLKQPRVNNWRNYFSTFIALNRQMLNLGNLVANILGRKPTYIVSKQVHRVIPILPVYLPTLPEIQKAKFVKDKDSIKPKVMYFPTCNNRIFADTSESKTHNALQQVIKKLGYSIVYPPYLDNLCCGQVFASKSDTTGANLKTGELLNAIKDAQCPVIMDNSSCLYSLTEYATDYNIMDSISFIHQHLDQLNLHQKYTKLALHIDCSTKKLGNENQIRDILAQCAREIITPVDIHCCGFAGDKGLTLPELNQSALKGLQQQINECEIGVTFNRNCQIGLSFYGKKTYLSLPEIVLSCLIEETP